MSTADWHPSTTPHRHLWRREGRILEVCASCPAARPRSLVSRGFSLVALGLGLLALAGMLVGVSHSHTRLALAQCTGSPQLSRSPGPGC